jgi:gas vesicle protein
MLVFFAGCFVGGTVGFICAALAAAAKDKRD